VLKENTTTPQYIQKEEKFLRVIWYSRRLPTREYNFGDEKHGSKQTAKSDFLLTN